MQQYRKARPWRSSITEVGSGKLITRGLDQRKIIRHLSYEEMVFLLVRGRRPSPVEAELLRAVIVSHVSHGITGQSVLAVRMAADCGSSFLHALFAGFSTGAGAFHLGALEATMRELTELAKLAPGALADHLRERLARGERIMGFGHRYHKKVDPRVQTLLRIARKSGEPGTYVSALLKVAAILKKEKRLPMNIDAAGGAILLDLGFDPAIANLVIVVGRAPMFAAAYLERLAEGRAPFQRIAVADLE